MQGPVEIDRGGAHDCFTAILTNIISRSFRLLYETCNRSRKPQESLICTSLVNSCALELQGTKSALSRSETLLKNLEGSCLLWLCKSFGVGMFGDSDNCVHDSHRHQQHTHYGNQNHSDRLTIV